MSLTVSYDSANARVVIGATGLPNPAAGATAVVQRSTDQITWTTVRGGAALTITSGAIGTLYDYEFTPGVTNYYQVFAQPTALWEPGSSGNYASTPDNAALDITGTVDLRADLQLSDWKAGAASRTVLAKWTATGNQRSYQLQLNTDGTLSVLWSNDGTAVLTMTSTAAVPVTSGRLAIRATLVTAGTRAATFYTSDTLAGTWTQLGTTVTGAASAIFAGTATATVGGNSDGTAALFTGLVYGAEIRNGIGGTVVASPQFAQQPAGTTSFTDSAGRVWTLNGTAAILGVPQTANLTPTITQVWLKSVSRPFLNQVVNLAGDTYAEDRQSRTTAYPVVGRSLPVAVTDVRLSRQYAVNLSTADAATAAALDALIASGDVLFLQAPAGFVVPATGVYVAASDTRATFLAPPIAQRWLAVTLTEVAAPGPDVIGTQGTWQTVVNTYATWTAEIAANADWTTLLTLVGSAADVIVP